MTNGLRIVLLFCGVIAVIEFFVSFEFSQVLRKDEKLANRTFSGEKRVSQITSYTSQHDRLTVDGSKSLKPNSPLSNLPNNNHSDVPSVSIFEPCGAADIFKNNVSKVAEVISSTGVVFKGLKVRSFQGERIIKNQLEGQAFSKPELVAGYNCSNWGVVTTIFEPTKAIKRVADMPSWCLVVVADTKTPTDYMELLNGLEAV